MANGGVFVLRNFYVSFCQIFKGELAGATQGAGVWVFSASRALIATACHGLPYFNSISRKTLHATSSVFIAGRYGNLNTGLYPTVSNVQQL